MHLYDTLAPWWPVLAPPESYADEAALLLHLLSHGLGREPGSLLELGSGVGGHATHWPAALDLTLLDQSEAMLAVSRALNPGRAHVQADLREVRLGRVFDAVLLHDAVMYLTDEADLQAAFATIAAHLAPGGVALVVPDHVAESFVEGVSAGGGEAADGRAARLLEWRWDPDPSDQTTRTEMSFLLRDPGGAVRAHHETHTMGLFPRRAFVRGLRAAGLEPVPIPMLDTETPYECFLAVRA